VSVGDAYNMNMTTRQHEAITSDTHSGFTTYNKNWNILEINVPNQDKTPVARI